MPERKSHKRSENEHIDYGALELAQEHLKIRFFLFFFEFIVTVLDKPLFCLFICQS